MSDLGNPIDAIGDYMPRGLMEWAPVLGAGAASGGTVLARMFAPAGSWFARNAEMTGVLVSSVVAGAMAVSPGNRPAAMMVFLGGLAAGLPRALESLMAAKGVAGIGYYAAETANPLLGQVQAQQLNGLGYATASQQPHAYGTVPGVAGVSGAIAGPMADHGGGAPVNLLGPATSHMALARHYGATHMG